MVRDDSESFIGMVSNQRSQTDGHKDANDNPYANLDINVSHMHNVPDGFLGPDRVLITGMLDVLMVSTRFEHTLYGYFIGKIMAFLVVEYYARNNWAKHGLKRIMMNSKGFIFFKFDSRAVLEAILEGGLWLIRKSLCILKKWSMDTRLLKEELTRILTSSMCNDSWGKSSFAQILIEVNSEVDLVNVVTIGIPSLSGDGFTKETIHVVSPPIVTTSNVVTPTVEKTNDGFQTVGKKKKRKGKSKFTYGETGNSLKKDNLSMSNSFSALNDDEEDVENVYDESANLIHNTKASGSLSFTATADDLMAQIQPADDNAKTMPSNDAKAVSEVNALTKVHEQVRHVKCKTIIQTSDDDQIDSNIIFDDPYVENNGGTSKHDSNAHDEYHEIQMLAYNVQREAENQKRLNNELKKQKELLQKELETCKDRVKKFESKTIQCSKYKETCEELERELRADKDTIERILKEKIKLKMKR
ncbi:zinc knuckle CX2CX4HX4C containing protein [Tanacetum coccineum]